MELQPVKKTNRLSYRPAQSAQTKDTKVQSNSLAVSRDQLALSKRAVAFLEQQAAEARAEAERASQKAAKNQTDAGSGESSLLDTLGQSLKTMKRCQEISRRIMSGDNITAKDRQYLMAHDAQGYQLAMAARRNNPDPKDWDSVIKEDEDTRDGETSGSYETTAPTAQPMPSSDGAFGNGDGT